MSRETDASSSSHLLSRTPCNFPMFVSMPPPSIATETCNLFNQLATAGQEGAPCKAAGCSWQAPEGCQTSCGIHNSILYNRRSQCEANTGCEWRPYAISGGVCRCTLTCSVHSSTLYNRRTQCESSQGCAWKPNIGLGGQCLGIGTCSARPEIVEFNRSAQLDPCTRDSQAMCHSLWCDRDLTAARQPLQVQEWILSRSRRCCAVVCIWYAVAFVKKLPVHTRRCVNQAASRLSNSARYLIDDCQGFDVTCGCRPAMTYHAIVAGASLSEPVNPANHNPETQGVVGSTVIARA